MKKWLYAALVALLLLTGTAFAENETGYIYDPANCRIEQSRELNMSGDIVLPVDYEGNPIYIAGVNLFYNNSEITSVVVPEPYRILEDSAFDSCEGLVSVTLPNTLEAIGNYAFNMCRSLQEIRLPASLGYIGSRAFIRCESLQTVIFEGHAPTLGEDWVFDDNITFVVPDDCVEEYRAILPQKSTIVSSGQNAVPYNYDLSGLQFDASTGTVTGYTGDAAVIILPAEVDGVAVKAIGAGAFRNETNIYCVVLPEGLERVEEDAFAGLRELRVIKFPSTLKSIGNRAFSCCYIYTLDLPEGLETIGDEAFVNCYVNTLRLPEGLIRIGDGAFIRSWNLYDVYFPSTIQYVGNHAFDGANLGYLVFACDTLPEFAPEAFDQETREKVADVDMPVDCSRADWEVAKEQFAQMGFVNCTVWRMNPADIGLAKAANPWESDLTIYEEGLLVSCGSDAPDLSVYGTIDNTRIYGVGDGCFKGSTTIRSFYPNHCDWFTTIGNEAFAGSSLEYVDLFDSITTIGEGAFRDCVNITELTIPSSVTFIGADAFAGCTGLQRVDVQCDASLLPEGVFRNCPNLTEVAWSCGAIPANAVAGSGFTTLRLGEGVTAIGDNAFSGCANLTEVALPETLSSIGANAFAGSAVTELTIPANVSYMGENAFGGGSLAEVLVLCDPACLSDSCSVYVPSVRLPASASDDAVETLSAKLGLPWYQPILRDGEEAVALAEMPFAPNDEAFFEIDPETGTLTKYTGTAVDVVIPRSIGGVTVRSISYTAFDSCRDYTGTEVINNVTSWVPLRTVIIPETVECIDDQTFCYCQQLENFVCYAPLETTGRSTFLYCTSLKNVTYVNGVRMLDNYLFERCDSLQNVYAGKRLQSIGIGCFTDSGIASFAIDAREVSNSAFRRCQNLTELHITGRVKAMETGAVLECENLTAVCLEGNRAAFLPGDGLCSGCSKAMTLYVSSGMTEEEADYAVRRLCVWNPEPTEVTMVSLECGRLPEEALIPDPGTLDQTEHELASAPEQIEAVPVGEEGAPYLGIWYVDKIVMDGETLSLADFGIEMAIAFQEDGTCVFMGGDEDEEAMTWRVENGMVYLDSMTGSILADGSLELREEDGGMICTRTAPEGVNIDLTPSNGGEGIEAYLGAWNVERLIYGDGAINIAEFGMTITVTLNEDGSCVIENDGDVETVAWSMQDGAVYVDDMPAYITQEGYLMISEEEGGMLCARAALEIVDPVPVEPVAASVDTEGFLGEWSGVSMIAGGMELSMTGMNYRLTINGDGTCFFSNGESTEYAEWVADSQGVLIDTIRVTRVEEEGVEFLLLEEEGATIRLARPQEEPGIIEEPAATAGGILFEVRYVCSSFDTEGYTLDGSLLGADYSIVFHESRVVDFTMAGVELPGLKWEYTDSGMTMDYYGTAIEITFTETGFDLNYFDSMMMHFVAQ